MPKMELNNDMDARISNIVNPDVIASFMQNGAIMLPRVLTAEELALLENGIEFNLKNLSPRAKIASRAEDSGKFIEDFCTWQDNDFYQKFIKKTPLAAIAGRLLDSKQIRLYHDHLLVKEPNTIQKTPWHQDQPYYNIEGQQNISFWIPIDPIPMASTLEFIAGSHRGPWLMPRTFMDNQAKWFPEGSLTELPDIENNKDDFHILRWALNPGDIIAFHMLSLHAAGGTLNQKRRVFSLRFIGDDIVHAPREWITSPEFPGLKETLGAGQPLHHDLFPLVWEN